MRNLSNYFVEGLQGAGKSTMVKRLAEQLPEYDEEILDFYCRLKHVLSGKQYQIIYLDVDDIRSTVELIKKERSDENGNELWFPLMTRYVEESPYGKAHPLHGMEGLIIHLERRKSLEHRIINEIFKDHTIIAKSKDYNLNELFWSNT